MAKIRRFDDPFSTHEPMVGLGCWLSLIVGTLFVTLGPLLLALLILSRLTEP